MHLTSKISRRLLLSSLGLLSVAATAQEGISVVRHLGESLVLPGTDPGQLAHPKVVPGSVQVRSTYLPGLPNTVVYEVGKDYTVNPETGQIRRTANSRIPDYTKNSLYGKKDFDHRNFPGFGNFKDFVFVDYTAPQAFSWPVQERQAKLLPRTWTRLRSGDTVTLSAFGDSITAGGDATAPELIFWQRWARLLQARYPKAKINAVNSATGGDTTFQGLARLDDKVLKLQPDLVIVGFGMNDQNVGSVPLDRFEANLGVIVDRIRASTPAEVILFSSFPPNPNWHYTSGRMPDYARVTQKVALAKGCAFADVFTNWNAILSRKKPEDILANNINHPNDYSHWMYFKVFEALGL